MSALTLLPATKEIKDLYEGLFGRDITVAPAGPPSVGQLANSVVATYIDDQHHLSGVAGMNFAFAAFAGAALGLIPKGAAEACIEDKELSKAIGENVAEACNIMAALLNREGTPHLKLDRAFLPGDPAPNDAQARLLALGNRIDLEVSIAGYGGGLVWVSLAG